MRPINFFKILIAISILSVCISFQGCINDDLSVCGVNLQFTYTRNLDGVDKFSESVERVDVFVFDSEGVYQDVYSHENIGSIKSMNINLSPGIYSFVVWGNLCDDYTLSQFVRGETRMNDAILKLTRVSDTITTHPGHLFHGAIFNEAVLPADQNNQTLTIDMIKDTKSITVTAVGLPVDPTKASTDIFACSITSVNGDYKFDNTITGYDRLHYIPYASVNADKELISDFITMRELNDGSTDSRLILRHNNSTTGEIKDLFNQSLVELLLPASVRGDLDIEDTFNIILEFDYVVGTVTVTVNGWTSGSTSGIL
ncbi:hypothetical protein M2459_002883 [Parabacteroides sp. PF5-5]|uniref:FimB/Mfa2 family fimbrial subunit n=1 Tax=unclassified Parabacteroides TaxID=2649774 RepID=UPI0024731878|nr:MULTISPECIES: FimB/Mfa2 family fimbrial subunit [unclassified Parabacteroides]MDH6306169.1 hypothetical protein [Parabacteroides sp. PH5-39]MDH6317128.1 hypothetical protein [Parabacteroides sp. PF5-13]MDH6320881.1 hypothetical protein [Parabacteroides sp. PH5-13]MDH6324612.1 hypothetical protein [Parabacteroides sp. PH5-8]MDH6328337.1 hypothetical protein [Parabacteroides sp. PH5-41]